MEPEPQDTQRQAARSSRTNVLSHGLCLSLVWGQCLPERFPRKNNTEWSSLILFSSLQNRAADFLLTLTDLLTELKCFGDADEITV